MAGSLYPEFVEHYYARNARRHWSNADGTSTDVRVNSKTEMKLYVGGKFGLKKKCLVHIIASAAQYGDPVQPSWMETPVSGIDAPKIKVLGRELFGRPLDPWGHLYVALPMNAEKDLNLRVPGVKHYNAVAYAERFELKIKTGDMTLEPSAVVPGANFIVGQPIDFSP